MPRAYFDGLHMFLDLNFLIEVNGVCFGVGAGGRTYQGGEFSAWRMILHFSQTQAPLIPQIKLGKMVLYSPDFTKVNRGSEGRDRCVKSPS